MSIHDMTKRNKFCMAIKLYNLKKFTGLLTPPALAKNFCDRNAVVLSVCSV